MSEGLKLELAKQAQNLREPFKIRKETRNKVRATLMGPPLEPQPIQEKHAGKETNPAGFEKIIFGHSFKDFDRDQLITYFLAYKLGLVNAETPISFQLEPTMVDFNDPATLIIEAYVTPENFTKATKKGNFLTGTQDEPAAAVFHHHFSREMQRLNEVDALKELVVWLKSVDTQQPLSKPLTFFNSEVLNTLTKIFHGLKLSQTEPATLLKESVALLDFVLANPKDPVLLQNKYYSVLTQLSEKRQQDFLSLEERAKNPQFLKTTHTLTGKKLAYFDVRGLNVEAGGLKIAQQKTNADVIFLIDDEGEQGIEATERSLKLVIKKNDDSLTERLQMSELLFGKGFKLKLRYGGHPGIVLSPPGYGTGLNPENIWVALQKHYNEVRYSADQFREKAQELANACGLERALQFTLPPSDEYSLAEWQLQLNVADANQSPRVITISESDLALYTSALTGNKEVDLKMLQQKTFLSEPANIVDKRLARTQKALEGFIANKEATQILLCLDDLNKTTLQKLNVEQQLEILATIAQDPLSIDQVWNKDNLQFRITHPIPDWVTKDLATYKAARFRYDSVPQKIDTTLIQSIISKLQSSAQHENWSRFTTILVSIISSDSYKKSHHEKSHDQLLESCLQVCLNPAIPLEVAKSFLTQLTEKFGVEMLSQWHTLSPQLITTVNEKFPTLLTFVALPTGGEQLPTKDTSFLQITEPVPEKIDPHAPIQTIFVEIGRPIEADLKQKGITALSETGELTHSEIDTFASEIRATNQPLRLDKEHADHVAIAEELLKHLLVIADAAPNSKIRIVAGSFMNMLTRKVITLIPSHLWDRVFFCDYNATSNEYVDDVVLSKR